MRRAVLGFASMVAACRAPSVGDASAATGAESGRASTRDGADALEGGEGTGGLEGGEVTTRGGAESHGDDESRGSSSAGEATRGTSGVASGGRTTTTVDPGESSSEDSGAHIVCRDDHRVVAFVTNWDACPTAEQLTAYSHVVIAFAVTYTWSETGNLCDPGCVIQPVEGCSGVALSSFVADLHAQGKEVLLSFGGAGMGGVWEGQCGEMVKCWDACLGRAEQVADQLAELVQAHDLDGIDIDYEYCLHSAAHRDFVESLTVGLRDRFDALFPGIEKWITHAPMDREVDVGEPYYEILERTAAVLDFVMPQYYNGGDSPFTAEGLARIEANYDALVEGVFGGDASRVTVGFCIEPGCQPVAQQPAALDVMRHFDDRYSDHGGLFFWAHPDDAGASFSAPFRAHYDETVCH